MSTFRQGAGHIKGSQQGLGKVYGKIKRKQHPYIKLYSKVDIFAVLIENNLTQPPRPRLKTRANASLLCPLATLKQ